MDTYGMDPFKLSKHTVKLKKSCLRKMECSNVSQKTHVTLRTILYKKRFQILWYM